VKVFVAGSTGALGIPVVKRLIERGHEVVALTRSTDKAATLQGLGARPVLGDVLDAARIKDVMAEAHPDAVAELLNALPKRGPIRIGELKGTNDLRIRGTAHLLAAATSTGARRFVGESMIFGYGYAKGTQLVTEEDPYEVKTGVAGLDEALGALTSLENQILSGASKGEIEGIVLRLGLFYGPGVGSTEFMARLLRRRMLVLPGGGHGTGSWIHVEDAANAVVLALESGRSGEVLNVVDDEPASLADFSTELARVIGAPRPISIPRWLARLGGRYAGMIASATLCVSNDKIKRELGWQPSYATYREGLRTITA
jgi:nucleoside-diphosphate-sugar epimerase